MSDGFHVPGSTGPSLNPVLSTVLFLLPLCLTTALGSPRAGHAAAPDTTHVQGAITANTTWTASGSPYIVTGDVRVPDSVTVTVQAGVVVKFEQIGDHERKRRLIVRGTLNLQGTAGNRVVFTSSRDDSPLAGGDTNGDGTKTEPSEGDWGYIQFPVGSKTSSFSNTVVRYGGHRDDNRSRFSDSKHDYMVWVRSEMDVRNNVFQESFGDALRVDVPDEQDLPTSPINVPITGNTVERDSHQVESGSSTIGINAVQAGGPIRDNVVEEATGVGIRVQGIRPIVENNTVRRGGNGIATADGDPNEGPAEIGAPTIQNNTIENVGRYPLAQRGYAFPDYSGNTIRGSTRPAVAVSGKIHPPNAADGVWNDIQGLGFPYVVTEDVRVQSDMTLSIEAGRAIKFNQVGEQGAKRRLIVHGELDLQGTPDNRVVFTSSRDDSPLAGGDTNGDDPEKEPSGGDWGYIQFPADSKTTSFSNAVARYGGHRDDNQSRFSDSKHDYIVWIQADVDVRNSVIESSYSQGIHVDVDGTENPRIAQNNIVDNKDYGLYNASSNLINAENNWWGDPTGPQHSSNASGKGNAVSDNVAFRPFLKSSAGAEVSRPTGVTAEAGVGEVRVSWDQNAEDDIAAYDVYRGPSPDPTTNITSVSDTTGYTDTDVTNETTYHYRITAVDTAGNESDFSANAKATPSAKTLLGDVSGDGSVQAFDGALVLQHVAGMTSRDVLPLMDSDSVSADVSGNGAISSFDASYILRNAAGLVGCFPASARCNKTRPEKRMRATSGDVLSWGDLQTSTETATLPLRVQADKKIYGIDLSISTSRPELIVDKVRAQLPSDWQVTRHRNGSDTHIALAGATPLSGGTVLTLRFDHTGTEYASITASGAVNESPPASLSNVEIGSRPNEVAVMPNYPNPVEQQTTIAYTLPTSQKVTLQVYNVIGQKVAVLVDERRSAGTHEVQWTVGSELGSGVYFYRLRAGDETQMRRMIVVQ